MVFCSLPGLCRPTCAPEESLSPLVCSGLPNVFDLGLVPLNRTFWQSWPGSHLPHPSSGVKASQETINPGPHPDISSLESLRCLSAPGGPGRPHSLGGFYPQALPRAASWLMAKWRMKHLWMEDQNGTGRKEFKCMCLLEKHYPHQHCGSSEQRPLLSVLLASEEHPLHALLCSFKQSD